MKTKTHFKFLTILTVFAVIAMTSNSLMAFNLFVPEDLKKSDFTTLTPQFESGADFKKSQFVNTTFEASPTEEEPSGLPTSSVKVAEGGFYAPTDIVASPNGWRFNFIAYTDEDESTAAIFDVPSGGGEPEVLYAGAPLSAPTGLVMSCDGSQLIVADMALGSSGDEDAPLTGGALYTIPTSGGEPTELEANGLHEPSGLALSSDCKTLYATGYTKDGAPALFRMPLEGGTAEVVYEGAPLASPTGMYVDKDEVAWVLDHVGAEDGEGALFAINTDGSLSTVLEGLALGAVGGCSLDAAGGTAFIPTTGEEGAVLTAVALVDGVRTEVTLPGVVEPAGLRTARNAPVFGLVDHEGNAIFRVQ